MAKAKTSTKKRKVNVEAVGQAHVTASFNNIIISLTNKKGDVISLQGKNATVLFGDFKTRVKIDKLSLVK